MKDTGIGETAHALIAELSKLTTERDQLREENARLREALEMARDWLPSIDSLPKTHTCIREIVEAVHAAFKEEA